jgi:hypothetical protein
MSYSNLTNPGPIVSTTDFEDTPEGWASRWAVELHAGKKEVEKWHTAANRCVKVFLDRRDVGVSNSVSGSMTGNISKINLFTANVQTMRAILYGKTPQVSVDRKWADTNDDVARVAGTIMERCLNEDIETPGDGYADSLQMALEDRLIVGLGIARVRYEAQIESQQVQPLMGPGAMDPNAPMGTPPPQVEIAPGYTHDVKTDEFVPTDYVNWRDFLWSPARTWGEVRWVAFRALMTEDDGVKRFGEDFKQVPRSQANRQTSGKNSADATLELKDPWQRAEVWEIWDKESQKVYWWTDGYTKILDIKPDPLKLPAFFPCPRPFIANTTTTQFIPTPDYILAQDLYIGIDTLETRIDWLVKACKLVGVYDSSSVGIGRMFTEANETELIPVDNWAMFAEKGGIKGQVDWLPIEAVSATIAQLVSQRDQKIQLLYQVTGMSDIMRGQSEKGVTATEQSIKAKFASVRIQALQDEFAHFATDLQALKAHIITTQYDDQKIITASNIEYTDDAQLAPQAVQLLRSQLSQYRVIVRPEALAITDYGAMQAERSAAGQAMGQLAEAASNPQLPPQIQVAMWETAKWILASFKGSATIEAAWDRALEEMKQQAQQPAQPDPAQQAQQQADAQKAQADQVKAQAEGTKAQASVIVAQTDLQKAKIEALAPPPIPGRGYEQEFRNDGP